jgi:ribonucleoside-diphosphate reductase alpha chain
MAMAGPAAERDSTTIYNCAYAPVDRLETFSDALTVSMAGCGFGFSVEKEYVDQLPEVKATTGEIFTYLVEDSALGWRDALLFGMRSWFEGHSLVYDYSELRPAGAILKTKGGRSSGPGALEDCLNFCGNTVRQAQGRKLTPIECHDMMCSIGNCAISGGVRRTALISLFDWDDEEMRNAKKGDFPAIRWNANNSIVWPKDITQEQFVEQFVEMHKGMNGEPGIFNREAAYNTIPERREKRKFGMNPCGEVFLRPRQFCNLSIAIARSNDTAQSLADKVEIASIIGTIQSMATNFQGLSDEWKKNCEEERLLGVDITGQMDCSVLQDSLALEYLKIVAVNTNKEYAERLGINQSVAVTCAKPSGNSSVLFNCAPGIHTRWSEYYMRNVRISVTSPLCYVLMASMVPMSPENGQTVENATTWVVHFPCKSPEGAVTRHDVSALGQCRNWAKVKENYTEHNPSVTITYKGTELLDVMCWVWRNKDIVSGMSFLPDIGAKYDQMPYEEITAEEYESLSEIFPEIRFELLEQYEKEDMTTLAQEVACSAGGCLIGT